MKHNKKHCPAIVGMYYYVDGIKSVTAISKVSLMSTSVVEMILARKYNETKPKKKAQKEIIESAERDYLAGMSTYALGEKYGVNHSTISLWMKKLGYVRGKGYISEERRTHDAAASEVSAAKKAIEKAERKKERDALLAKRRVDREAELLMQKEHRRLEREAEYAEEYAKEKRCASCGAVFHSKYKTKLYCSDKCSKRENYRRNPSTHRKRARKYGVVYEPGITVEKLIERDDNICQICGQPCDSDDLSWGSCGPLYPSIDHIIALKNGGSHTWDNVQLAHCICNSYKRDLIMTR